MTTDRRQLAELAYPGGAAKLDAFVAARLKAGDSYRTIADSVSSKMKGDICVSREWVRRWYPRT